MDLSTNRITFFMSCFLISSFAFTPSKYREHIESIIRACYHSCITSFSDIRSGEIGEDKNASIPNRIDPRASPNFSFSAPSLILSQTLIFTMS